MRSNLRRDASIGPLILINEGNTPFMTTQPLKTPEATAQFLGVTVETLAVWRSTGRYNIPFIKVGRSIRYRQSDLEKWLDERTRESGATA